MYYTTLNKIRNCRPCIKGWDRLLRHLGKTQLDDEPLALATILEANGIEDAVWVLRAVDGIDGLTRLFAVRCVRQHCQHLLTDPRSLAALDVSEMHAVGWAADEDLDEVRAAAWAMVGEKAWEAVRNAAQDAAREAVGVSVGTAAWGAAWDAARHAARDAARDAAWATIEADYRAIFCESEA